MKKMRIYIEPLPLTKPYQVVAALMGLSGKSHTETALRRRCFDALIEHPLYLSSYFDYLIREGCDRSDKGYSHIYPTMRVMKQAAGHAYLYESAFESLLLLKCMSTEKCDDERLMLVRKILRMPIKTWLQEDESLIAWRGCTILPAEVELMFAVVKRSGKAQWAQALLNLRFANGNVFTDEQSAWLASKAGIHLLAVF